MEELEQPVSKWSSSFRARVHIFGYVSAFTFLFIEGGKLSNVLIQAVGMFFLIPAFLIFLAQFRIGIIKRVAKFADDVSSFPMYMVVITIFIREVFDWINFTQRVEVLWAIPIVLLALIVYDIIDIVKCTRAMGR